MPWHTAIVNAPDGVRFVATCQTERELLHRLASYVTCNAPLQLWQDDALRVEGLVRDGRLEEAVEYYFSRAGDRWDEERLVRTLQAERDAICEL